MSGLLLSFAIRFTAFGLVFAFAAWKNPNVIVQPKIALPVVALVFAFLNAALYPIAKAFLGMITIGPAWLILPFLLNGALVWATARLARPLQVKGFGTLVYLAALLTAAHALLALGFHLFG